jgi:endonuclease III
MPSLVKRRLDRQEQNSMMVFVDDGDSGDDEISFSDESDDAEEEEDVNVYFGEHGKENEQPHPSHLRLRVMVNGEAISESDSSVGEIPLTTKRVPLSTKRATRVKRAKKNPRRPKKGKLTLTLKPRASLKPTPTTLPKPIPLPNGEFQAWLVFGDNGGYSVTREDWTRIRAWVSLKRSRKDFVAEAVTFHRLILSLKRDLSLESARDCWERVLPPKNADNYPVCCLFLMICTPLVPDTKIVDIFEPIFRNTHVTVDWILEQTEAGIRELLRPLGRQTNSSKYVIASMVELKRRGGVLPRDYRVLTQFPGVGPKVALVTCQEVYGDAQGVPHDIHMCREFTALGWVPPTDESSLAGFLSKKEAYSYEMCRASMEG